MKWLVLTIVSATLMVHGQAAKPHSDTHTRNSATKSADATDTAGQTVVVVNQQASQGHENDHPSKPPSYLHELLVPANLPNLLLVCVGIAGIVAAFLSLQTINRQVVEMRRQIDITFGQLRAMHETITEMSEQTNVLEKSVAATERNAEAAKASADALINAERPWIVVSLKRETSYPENPHIRVSLILRNHGSTPAIIKAVDTFPRIVKNADDLPTQPDYGLPAQFVNQRLLAPRERWNYEYWDVSTISMPGDFDAVLRGEKHFYYFGVIRYQDTFRPNITHETRFCYKYFQRGDFFNIRGPSEYTKYT